MSYGYSRTLSVMNGVKENGEPKWYQIARFEDDKRFTSLSIAKSKKNSNEVYLAEYTNGYSVKLYKQWYYIGGEMVCFRMKQADRLAEWTGDALPTFPTQLPINVVQVMFDEVARKVINRDAGIWFSLAAIRAAYVGRGWRYNHKMARADMPDGTHIYFKDGKEVASLNEAIADWYAGLEYKDTYIVPKDTWASKVPISEVKLWLSTFQQPNLDSAVRFFVNLDEMVQNMSDLSVNQKEAMADIARVLHIAVEDIKKYASMDYSG